MVYYEGWTSVCFNKLRLCLNWGERLIKRDDSLFSAKFFLEKRYIVSSCCKATAFFDVVLKQNDFRVNFELNWFFLQLDNWRKRCLSREKQLLMYFKISQIC